MSGSVTGISQRTRVPRGCLKIIPFKAGTTTRKRILREIYVPPPCLRKLSTTVSSYVSFAIPKPSVSQFRRFSAGYRISVPLAFFLRPFTPEAVAEACELSNLGIHREFANPWKVRASFPATAARNDRQTDEPFDVLCNLYPRLGISRPLQSHDIRTVRADFREIYIRDIPCFDLYPHLREDELSFGYIFQKVDSTRTIADEERYR